MIDRKVIAEEPRQLAVDPSLDGAAISRCRELLGDEANALSDKDVDQVRRHADAVARLIVEVFQKQAHRA